MNVITIGLSLATTQKDGEEEEDIEFGDGDKELERELRMVLHNLLQLMIVLTVTYAADLVKIYLVQIVKLATRREMIKIR